MNQINNQGRLWSLDRGRLDYSSLPVVLDGLFMPAYKQTLLEDVVARAVRLVDLHRARSSTPRGITPIQMAVGDSLEYAFPANDFDVQVSLVEDSISGLWLAAVSDCPVAYMTEWNRLPGAEPVDLFRPIDSLWKRMFPNGFEQSRCLNWKLLGGVHRTNPLELAQADPWAVEQAVPSREDRLDSLQRNVAVWPGVSLPATGRTADAGGGGVADVLEEIVSKPVSFETLTLKTI